MKLKMITSLLLILSIGNASAFTSTKYLDKLLKVNVSKEVIIVGAQKITTITTTKIDENGNTTTKTEKLVEDVQDSEYLRVLEQVKTNAQRIGALEEMYTDIETQIEAIRQDSLTQSIEFEDLTELITPLKAQVLSASIEVEAKQTQVVQLALEYQALANSIFAHQSQVNAAEIKLRDEKARLISLMENMNDVNTKLASYMSDFNTKLANVKAQYEALRSTVEQRANAVDLALTSLNVKLDELTASGLTMTQEYLELLSELTTLNAQYTAALTQIEELNTEYDNHTHLIEGLQTTTPIH